MSDSTWTGVWIAILWGLTLIGMEYTSKERGRREVIEACSNYNRYKIPDTTQYMNCGVTSGPEIVPNSTAGKKK